MCSSNTHREILTTRFRVGIFHWLFVVVCMRAVIEKSKCVGANISRGLPVGPHLVRSDVHNRPLTRFTAAPALFLQRRQQQQRTSSARVLQLHSCCSRATCSHPTKSKFNIRSFVNSTASTDLAKSRATSGTARVIDR
ncbi:DNA mismatch repair protein MutS [Trichinella pseudospiralis]